MELSELVSALTAGDAFPVPSLEVQVRHTHISVVFLAGSFAYKIKKPVNFGFADFGTLELRRHFCEEEVLLNRRLAPGIYLGVVPIRRSQDGIHAEGSEGAIVEWAVKMRRLPDEQTLRHRLSANDVTGETIGNLARLIAAFHASADRSPEIVANATFAAVSKVMEDNWSQAGRACSAHVSGNVITRVGQLTLEHLERQRTHIDDRATRNVPCDCHGDLRLDHVYVWPGNGNPEFAIIDCIEFNPRFRHSDPVADIAFLAMDFRFHSRRDFESQFTRSYFKATGDADGRGLLPLYVGYRAVVRSKVEALLAAEPEVPESERSAAIVRARAYWLLALGVLEETERRPCLLLLGGLPGTGKSTLARALSEKLGFEVIRSDFVRKQLAGRGSSESSADFAQGIYMPEWTQRTYDECRNRAEQLLGEGKRVIIDANFGSNRHRRDFLQLAEQVCVPAALLVCQADPTVVRARLQARQGDLSDATWSTYLDLAQRWEAPDLGAHALARPVDTGGSLEHTFREVAQIVAQLTKDDD
jgi:aminoglycoside phosphotransferase family enzyme/predicted kinase